MSHRQARPISPSSIVAACLAGALAADIVLATTQSLLSPRLTGEAAPPASVLSLWYRTPASDHPLLAGNDPRESREGARMEWVRALPIGTGRLGAMVFGGVVHERLQLNPGHPLGRATLRSRESGSERRAIRGKASAGGAQVRRGGKARGDVEAARANAVRDGWRSRAHISRGRLG
jgi:Glycosyl hydrolase family 65, N-terminal domain